MTFSPPLVIFLLGGSCYLVSNLNSNIISKNTFSVLDSSTKMPKFSSTQLAFYRHELHLFDPRGSEPDLLLVSSDSPAVSLLLLQFEPGGSGRGSILSTPYCFSLSVFVLVFSGPDRPLHSDSKGSVLEHLLSLEGSTTPDMIKI